MPIKLWEQEQKGDVLHQWMTDGTTVIHKRVQDVNPTLQSVQFEKDVGGHDSLKCEMKLAAEIPLEVYHEILKKAGYSPQTHTAKEEAEIIRRWLNDPDNSRFRVWGGRL